MIYLISGGTHTGKTNLAHHLMIKYNISYLSIDHLKMGLIRSGESRLNVYQDLELTTYLWNILKEMIKTAIENNQDMIIEGCYIPFDWQDSFDDVYLRKISYICLVMSENYINDNFDMIVKYQNVIENRLDDFFEKEELIESNNINLSMCNKYKLTYYLIDKEYNVDDIINYFDLNIKTIK